MPREYIENDSRQTKLSDVWWHPNAERELARLRDFWLVHHGHRPPWPPSGADLYIWLVRYHLISFPPFLFFSSFNLGVAMVAMVAML